MKKYSLSLILSVAAFASANAGYTGILVTDNVGQNTYYLFEEQPTVKYKTVEGVANACLYVTGKTDPIVSVPLTGGAQLTVRYDDFVRVTLNEAGYATFSAKDASFIATAGITAYKAAVNGELITLTELEGNIPAGTGVILYGETPETKVDLPVATSGSDADVTNNSLKPTTLSTGSLAEMESNIWALGSGKQFLKYTGTAFVHNRAYLVHENAGSAKELRFVFDNWETDAIHNAEFIMQNSNEAYNLNGMRVGKDYKGIVIVNGKKILNK